MASDIQKRLEKARRSLEKNKLREAVAEYEAILDEAPSHSEAVQGLADLYTRLNEPEQAAQYFGIQFDRLLDVGDAAKASAIFGRFLRPYPQPPDRLMRYATLLQKQNHASEAIEQFDSAPPRFSWSNSAVSKRWRATKAWRCSILKIPRGIWRWASLPKSCATPISPREVSCGPDS